MKKLAIALIVAILGVFTYATTLFNSYFWTSRIPSTLENAADLAMWIAAAFTGVYLLFVYLEKEYKKWANEIRTIRIAIVCIGVFGAVTFFDQSAALNSDKASQLRAVRAEIAALTSAEANAYSQGIVSKTAEHVQPRIAKLKRQEAALVASGAVAGNAAIDKLSAALPFLPYSVVSTLLGAFSSWIIDHIVFLLVMFGLSMWTELYPPKVNTRSASSSKQDRIEQILELWDELDKKPTIKQVMDLLSIQKTFAGKLINEAKKQRGNPGNSIPLNADSGEFHQRKSA